MQQSNQKPSVPITLTLLFTAGKGSQLDDGETLVTIRLHKSSNGWCDFYQQTATGLPDSFTNGSIVDFTGTIRNIMSQNWNDVIQTILYNTQHENASSETAFKLMSQHNEAAFRACQQYFPIHLCRLVNNNLTPCISQDSALFCWLGIILQDGSTMTYNIPRVTPLINPLTSPWDVYSSKVTFTLGQVPKTTFFPMPSVGTLAIFIGLNENHNAHDCIPLINLVEYSQKFASIDSKNGNGNEDGGNGNAIYNFQSLHDGAKQFFHDIMCFHISMTGRFNCASSLLNHQSKSRVTLDDYVQHVELAKIKYLLEYEAKQAVHVALQKHQDLAFLFQHEGVDNDSGSQQAESTGISTNDQQDEMNDFNNTEQQDDKNYDLQYDDFMSDVDNINYQIKRGLKYAMFTDISTSLNSQLQELSTKVTDDVMAALLLRDTKLNTTVGSVLLDGFIERQNMLSPITTNLAIQNSLQLAHTYLLRHNNVNNAIHEMLDTKAEFVTSELADAQDIIRQKDLLLKERDLLLKEKDLLLKEKDNLLIEKEKRYQAEIALLKAQTHQQNNIRRSSHDKTFQLIQEEAKHCE